MQIGIVGKPNVGKSTFFSAATMATVEIGNYPFTTIEPNKGVAYVRVPCPCKEFGIPCNPHNSICINGTRLVPVELLDVAGLVPDSWKGRGLGNKFLDDLRQADALINVVDASGSSDAEGHSHGINHSNPVDEVRFLRLEVDLWIREIIKNGLGKIARQAKMQGTKPEAILHERLAGLNTTESQIKEALRHVDLPADPMLWDDESLLALSTKIREMSKPMIIAMNKADIAPVENLEALKGISEYAIPTMSETELALKKAALSGLVEYEAGDRGFKIKDPGSLNEGQRKALAYMAERMEVNGGTGIQECIEMAVLGLLGYIAVWPVEDDSKFTNHAGKVFPDCLLVPNGSTTKDLAYRIHSDLGDSFIRAINARTKRVVGADTLLQNGDIIRIVSGK